MVDSSTTSGIDTGVGRSVFSRRAQRGRLKALDRRQWRKLLWKASRWSGQMRLNAWHALTY